MIRRFVLAGALALVLLPRTAATAHDDAAQGGAALAGSVYRNGAGSTSTALVGALVYVRDTKADASVRWTGPVLTDAYGRFAFGDLAPGRYVLRVFVARKRVWEQVVPAPGRLAPIVVPATE